MSWRLPVADLVITESDARAVSRALRCGTGMGWRTREFERQIAIWTGAAFAVAVASGTAALHLACMALGIGNDQEVIVPAMTFLATAAAPRYGGSDVVLADSVSPTDLNIDIADVERRITPRTRAVMAVHMWGYAADVLPLRRLCDERGLALIEDTAQGIGAFPAGSDRQAGTVGHIGCLSLFSKKQLSVGEGGVLLTDDEELAARARLLREGGLVAGIDGRAYDVIEVGEDYAFDDARAALALSRLPRLAAAIDHRRAVVRAYREGLAGLDGLTLMFDDDAVERGSHFCFGVLFDTPQLKERVREALADDGVQTTRYPVLHELTEYATFAPPGSLPNAEAAAERHLVLPIASHLSLEDVQSVVDVMRRELVASPAALAG